MEASSASWPEIFRSDWQFVKSVADMEGLPEIKGAEIAFSGRSNVGKSSLINALLGRKSLARTSNTPGRTQMLNFFAPLSASCYLVDMPGYGYAKAPKTIVENWTGLIHAYLLGRPNLKRVFLLIDSRHGLKKNDEQVMDLLDDSGVIYQIILTKCDKINEKACQTVVEQISQMVQKRPAAFPQVLVTSAEKLTNLDAVRYEIAGLLA